MNRRIAHRPRYRDTHFLTQHPLRIRNNFYARRWSYRNLKLAYPKPILGQRLLQVPVYRFVHTFRL